MRSSTAEIMASSKYEQIVCSIRLCQLQKVPVKAMFTLTVLEILLSEGRSVLSPAKRSTVSKSVYFQVKNQINIRLLLKILEKYFHLQV